MLPDVGQEQVAALHSLGLAAAKGQQFDEASKKIAQAFNVPIALVSLADEIHPTQPDATDLSQENQAINQAPHEEPLGAYVIAANEVLVSEDVTEDPRFADDPRVLEKGIRFYAGVPLRTSAGHVVGSLCIVDTQPREFLDRDRQRLDARRGHRGGRGDPAVELRRGAGGRRRQGRPPDLKGVLRGNRRRAPTG